MKLLSITSRLSEWQWLALGKPELRQERVSTMEEVIRSPWFIAVAISLSNGVTHTHTDTHTLIHTH